MTTQTHTVSDSEGLIAGTIEFLSGEYFFYAETEDLSDVSCWATESDCQSGTIRQLEAFIQNLENRGYSVETV